MGKLKIPIHEATILLLHKNVKVETNFIFLGGAELLKLEMMDM
jgi:hypothetical protein